MKVRDILKLIEADGWYLVTTRPSTVQAPDEGWTSDDCWAPGRRLGARHAEQHPQTGEAEGGQIAVYRFLVVIEKANGNFSVYSPDLPGCVATGATREEAERNMHDAIEMHVQGLREDNVPIPDSQSFAEYIAVP